LFDIIFNIVVNLLDHDLMTIVVFMHHIQTKKGISRSMLLVGVGDEKAVLEYL
jgi:hypothetical protein